MAEKSTLPTGYGRLNIHGRCCITRGRCCVTRDRIRVTRSRCCVTRGRIRVTNQPTRRQTASPDNGKKMKNHSIKWDWSCQLPDGSLPLTHSLILPAARFSNHTASTITRLILLCIRLHQSQGLHQSAGDIALYSVSTMTTSWYYFAFDFNSPWLLLPE